MVLKAWPPLDGQELRLDFRGRPAPGLGKGKPVARGQLLAESLSPSAGDLVAPAEGVITSASPTAIFMRAQESSGGRPPEPVNLSNLHGESLGAALKKLGIPKPLPPAPGQSAIICALNPEPGLETAGALWRDLKSALKAGAEVLRRLWPKTEILEIVGPGQSPLGAGKAFKAAPAFPLALPGFLRLLATGRHDPQGRGVVPAELIWAMGSAARTSLPPPLIPITIQRFPYLAPLGLKIADALESLNLIALEGDSVVLGGLVTGRPTARLDRGLGWSMGALHLVRARKAPGPPGPCLRCGSCRAACPLDLRIDLLAAFEVDAWPRLLAGLGEALSGCLRCGACALACPSSRPLMALALMAGRQEGPLSFSALGREASA
ncbi:MAG: hypothetical protein LBE49_04205 [Deltaproteobacteria bacterium]|jgi:electron transport complex protein RnfC|nr:hypothetical protein [Deltaproteobacteria bacterium]